MKELEISMKSWHKPTPDLVEKAIVSTARPEQRRYFFERLENPEWIEPLLVKGFFSGPPSPIQKEPNVIEFRLWPESRYLARMASHAPELVASIMIGFKGTENPFVIRDILDAALNMPPDAAAKLASTIASLTAAPGLVGIERAGEVALRLAQAGHEKRAIEILNALFEVIPDPRPPIRPSREGGRPFRREAITRIRNFEFGNMIQRHSADYAKYLKLKYLGLLIGKLQDALKEETRAEAEGNGLVEDYSYIWRADLEYSSGAESCAKHPLIWGLVKACELLQDEGLSADVFKRLDKPPFKIFRRILLHTLSRKPDSAPELVAEKLIDEGLFHDHGVRQEYDELAAAAFAFLTAEQKESILAMIEKGLNRDRLSQAGYTLEQIDQSIDSWRLQRIHPMRTGLSSEQLKRFEDIEAKVGPVRAYRNPVVQGFRAAPGAESPKSTAELRTLDPEGVLAYVSAWTPAIEAHTPWGPSQHGLGTALAEDVAARPDAYMPVVSRIKTLEPTYVRSALEGFGRAARDGHAPAWQPFFELSAFVLQQDPNFRLEGDGWRRDPNWIPGRFAALELVDNALKNDKVSFSQRAALWDLICALAEEGHPDLDYRNPDAQQRDSWTDSVNAMKPRAVRQAVQYIQWCRTHLGEDNFSFSVIPEVREFLDRHLDPAEDPCLSVRLVYGEKLAFLHAMDAQWLKGSLDRIFPQGPGLQPLRDIAWGAYLAANYVYDDLFVLLEMYYRNAVNNLDIGLLIGKGHLLDEPKVVLGQHLFQLYWRGKLDLAATSLLTEFMHRADAGTRHGCIVYVGRSLSGSQDEVPADILKRLEEFWLSRFEAPDRTEEEHAAFGWWFETRHFADALAINCMKRSLEISEGKFEPLLNALDRFAALVRAYPSAVVSCVRKIVLAQPDYIDLWSEQLGKIFAAVLDGADPKLRSEVSRLINDLGARGEHRYRSLLGRTSQ
jgi:hypothetical protein